MANTLASLALLKTFADTNRAYIDLFIPLVAETIRRSQTEVVSLSDLQGDMISVFGLNIPQHALETILARTSRAGYLEKREGAYYKVQKSLSGLNFRDTQQKVIKKHEALAAAIRTHATAVFNRELTETDAEEALLSYLDQYGIDIVKAGYRNNLIPKSKSPVQSTRLIIGDYLLKCANEHSSHFEFFETVAKGLMLANAVFLPDPAKYQKRFRNTVLYLDTSILIYALGYAGTDRQAPIKEMLTLCYETGAELRCFKHTLEETRGALDAAAEVIRSGQVVHAYGPSIEYFLIKGSTASDIELHAARIERDLHTLRVTVEEKPSYNPSKYNINEKALEKCLEDAIGYRRERARLRDVDSVAAIMRARKGRQSTYVEDSGALFVTTNRTLVNVTRDFFWDEDSPNAVPPFISDVTLTNVLWLKKPLRWPDLPAKRIIADTYAAIQPDDELWHRFISEAEKLKDQGEIMPDELLLLRYGAESKRVLMELIAGEAFTQGTVREILEMVRERIRQDLEQDLRNSENTRKDLQRKLNQRDEEHQKRKQRLLAKGLSFGKIVSKFIGGAFFIVFLIGGSFSIRSTQLKPILRFLVAGIQFGIVFLSAANLAFGTSMKSLLRRIETKAQDAFVRRFM